MIAAWLAHLYTASGAVLALQIIVDATDGALARAAHVSQRIPWFNGAKLDDIVDFLTFVFVPALIVWRATLVPDAWRIPAASALVLSSAFGFNRDDAKTNDHFFTGFPSYWNIVVFYLMVAGWSPAVNLAVLLGLAVLVFVPIRYIYPSRTPVWRMPMNLLGAVWGVSALAMLWQFPDVSRRLFWLSLVYPIAYGVLSLLLDFRRRAERSRR